VKTPLNLNLKKNKDRIVSTLIASGDTILAKAVQQHLDSMTLKSRIQGNKQTKKRSIKNI
jgi:hypothetical protein